MGRGQKDPIGDAITKLDGKKCVAEAQKRDLNDDDLVKRIIHSGALILQRSGPDVHARRDAFVVEIDKYLASRAATVACEALQMHARHARLVEVGYSNVLATLELSTGDIPKDQHMWGALERLHYELLALNRTLKRDLRKRPAVDPVALHLTGDYGGTYTPDGAVSGLVNVASATLKMFAYSNGWFDREGHAVLPVRPFVPAKIRNRIGQTFLLGMAWRVLDRSSERWRFFGGEVRIERPPAGAGDAGGREVLEFRIDGHGPEIMELIAGQRLERMLFQIASEAGRFEYARADAGGAQIPLPPQTFLGDDEVIAVLGLSQILHFAVTEDAEEYGGLRLIEWIRGYFCLKDFLKQQHASRGLVRFTPQDFSALAAQYGLTSPKASALLKALEFGRDSIDLFDAPILVGADGFLYAVPAVVRLANVARVVLSQLSGLDIPISRKGKALELAVRERLGRRGIRCVGFKFKIDGIEYECDGAFIWDRILFVLECKNLSYSGHKPSRLYGFFDDMTGGIEQAKRMREFFAMHPEVVRQHLGPDAQWDRIVACVVNGIPFSLGKHDDVSIYDASALARFFESPTLNMVGASATRTVSLPFDFPGAQLWSGTRPAADDLVRQMEDPIQVKMLESHFKIETEVIPASNSLLIATPRVRSVEVPLDAMTVAKLHSLMDHARK